jgi:signal peptidase I
MAAFLTLAAAPGAGHVYAGRLRRGVVAFAALVLAGLALALIQWRDPGAAPALGLVVPSLWLGFTADAWLSARRSEARAPWRTTTWFTLTTLSLALVLGAAVQSQFSESFSVSSTAMIPVLVPGDVVLVDRRAYANRMPQAGDLVLFADPDDPSGTHLLRITGTPGDVVELRGRDVWINGSKLAHTPEGRFDGLLEQGPLFSEQERTPAGYAYTVLYPPPELERRLDRKWQVPPDAYFVLGDNRDHSVDSTTWQNPFVPRADLRGQVVQRIFSTHPRTGAVRWERIGGLPPPPGDEPPGR